MKKIIDGNYMVKRCFYATRNDAGNSQGAHVSTVFKFLQCIWPLQQEFPELIAVFDGGHASFRKNIFPEYKKRKPHKDPQQKALEERKLKFSYSVLNTLLPKMGIPVLRISGYEADDIIYGLVRHYSKQGTRVDIVSDDSDMLQVLNSTQYDCSLVRVHQVMKDRIIDIHNFEEVYGYKPSMHVHIKALEGDPSDNIKGVPSIGNKTAIKILNECGEDTPPQEHLIEWSELGLTKQQRNMIEFFSTYKRNLKLVDFQNIPETVLEKVLPEYESAKREAKVDTTGVNNIFKDLEFQVFGHWISFLANKERQQQIEY